MSDEKDKKDKREQFTVIGYVLVTMGAVAAIVFVLNLPRSSGDTNIDFCRSVFGNLARGKSSSAQAQIDWEHLKAMGVDVGSTYAQMRTAIDRSRYQDSFVNGFAKGFQATGAHVSSFVNWRIYERKEKTITVAVDYPKYSKTLLMVISAGANPKLEAIHWRNEESG